MTMFSCIMSVLEVHLDKELAAIRSLVEICTILWVDPGYATMVLLLG